MHFDRGLVSLALLVCLSPQPSAAQGKNSPALTFYGQVLPVIQKRCLSCHNWGGLGRFPLVEYKDVQSRAEAIRAAVTSRRMPPWFADPASGEFANDPRLPADEIRLIENWVAQGAPSGKFPKSLRGVEITSPDEFTADMAFNAPRRLEIQPGQKSVQSLTFPLPFTQDRWIQAVEIRPSNPGLLQYAELYIRDSSRKPQAGESGDEILAAYAPGSGAVIWPEGMAKRIPAYASLVLQLHYPSLQAAATDDPEVRLAVAPGPPRKRVLTIPIRPGQERTLGGDALLLNVLPQVFPQGAASTFSAQAPGGKVEPVLNILAADTALRLRYAFKTPRAVRAGTALRWTPSASSEGSIGSFDVAVDPALPPQNAVR